MHEVQRKKISIKKIKFASRSQNISLQNNKRIFFLKHIMYIRLLKCKIKSILIYSYLLDIYSYLTITCIFNITVTCFIKSVILSILPHERVGSTNRYIIG